MASGNYFPLRMLEIILNDFPDETIQAFEILFNQSIDLLERISKNKQTFKFPIIILICLIFESQSFSFSSYYIASLYVMLRELQLTFAALRKSRLISVNFQLCTKVSKTFPMINQNINFLWMNCIFYWIINISF